MARACEVCNHSKRHEIDLAIIQNKNISQIARDYNVSYYSVYKHKKNHIQRKNSCNQLTDNSVEIDDISKKKKQKVGFVDD